MNVGRHSARLTVAACLVSLGCGSTVQTRPSNRRDPSHFNEQRSHAVNYSDETYRAKTVKLFRTTELLPDLDVRALATANEALYAGTVSGPLRLDRSGQRFERVPGAHETAVVDLFALSDGGVLVAHEGEVEVLGPSGAPQETLTSTFAVQAVAGVGADVYAGGLGGLYLLHANAVPAARARGFAVRDLAVANSVIWIASDRGVLRYDTEAGTMLPAARAPMLLADDDVRAIAISSDGRTIFAATARGESELAADLATAVIRIPGKGSIPNGDLRAISAKNGEILSGHKIGATVVAGGKVEHYHSLRWIPSEEVTAVALGSDRVRWIATHSGISRVSFEPTTLAAKAALFEQFLDRHWRMDGFLDDEVTFDDPWDLSARPHTYDKDNDGLWTEMQIGPWCMAYAATGDERYYQRARRALDVMLLEFDIPAVTFRERGVAPGFITRSLVRDDEGPVFEEKSRESNWHRQEFNGRTYYWKDDTSSDEYAGHYYGIPLFYDLCAKSEAEKEAIRRRIRSSTDYLIANKYLLIDLNGKGTTHGRWADLGAASEGLDACTAKYGFDVGTCVFSYHGGGWLNSLEILGHLLAAWHITGDQKYYDEYERLYTVERYGKMITVSMDTYTLSNPRFANHSDHELATLAYFTLLRYEPNADRREALIRSFLAFYEYERPEHNPWQVATIGSMYDRDVDLAAAIEVLKQMPVDWRTVPYDNSHRLDADRGPPGRHNEDQFTTAFPYDELQTMKWNGGPYEVRGGGDPRGVLSPTPYLIAYWTMRYYGLIRP